MSSRQSQPDEPQFLKTADVCARFGVQPCTLRRWRQRGWIPFSRIGHVVVFQPGDIKEAIQRTRVDNGPTASPAVAPPSH